MMRDTRNGFVALVALMVQYLAANETGQAAGARFDSLLQLRASIPEISKCRQLIVVTTEDWKFASSGFLTNRSPRQRKQSMILSPGTTIALLTGRQLHAAIGQVRNFNEIAYITVIARIFSLHVKMSYPMRDDKR
jgi:hypothetical protein